MTTSRRNSRPRFRWSGPGSPPLASAAARFPFPLYPHITSSRGLSGNRCIELFSPKLGRLVVATSRMEYSVFLALELDARNLWYCEQPLEVAMRIDGRLIFTRFDIATLDDSDHLCLGEAKPRRHLADTRVVSRQLPAQRAFCEMTQTSHKIWTEDDTRADDDRYIADSAQAVQYLAMYFGRDLTQPADEVLASLKQAGPLPIRSLIARLSDYHDTLVRAACCRLLAKGYASANLGDVRSFDDLMFEVRYA